MYPLAVVAVAVVALAIVVVAVPSASVVSRLFDSRNRSYNISFELKKKKKKKIVCLLKK